MDSFSNMGMGWHDNQMTTVILMNYTSVWLSIRMISLEPSPNSRLASGFKVIYSSYSSNYDIWFIYSIKMSKRGHRQIIHTLSVSTSAIISRIVFASPIILLQGLRQFLHGNVPKWWVANKKHYRLEHREVKIVVRHLLFTCTTHEKVTRFYPHQNIQRLCIYGPLPPSYSYAL